MTIIDPAQTITKPVFQPRIFNPGTVSLEEIFGYSNVDTLDNAARDYQTQTGVDLRKQLIEIFNHPQSIENLKEAIESASYKHSYFLVLLKKLANDEEIRSLASQKLESIRREGNIPLLEVDKHLNFLPHIIASEHLLETNSDFVRDTVVSDYESMIATSGEDSISRANLIIYLEVKMLLNQPKYKKSDNSPETHPSKATFQARLSV